jgi:mono/diheme cytochrome c family protein
MQTIVKGEQLFKQNACYGCHKIDGFSKGNVGPELTYEGRTAVPSTIEHQLWDPRYKVNSCVMPYFFSYRILNTDEMTHDEAIGLTNGIYANPKQFPEQSKNIVDWRALTIKRADIEDPDTIESEAAHGYIPNAAMQPDVDALVTFVSSQTGQNYTGAQADRMAMIAAYNVSSPATVPVTVEEGKLLFETSGCYACHTIGDPKWTGDPTKDPKAKGGVAGPQLTWEGARHSQQWLIEHYKNPQAFVPNSVMPIFPFSDSQRKALALYDQSLMPNTPGARPVSSDQDMPNDSLTKAGAQTPDIRYMTR